MKKTLLILLTLSVLFAFIGCGVDDTSPSADAVSSEASAEAFASSEDSLSAEGMTQETVTKEVLELSSVTSSEAVSSETGFENTTVSKDIPDTGFKAEVLSDKTYSVYLIKKNDGTYTVTAIIPAKVESGKIVVTVSKNLTLIEGSLSTAVPGGVINENYNRNGISGACVAFASATVLPEGTVAFTASYTAAEGVNISESDITVPDWNLTSGNSYLGTGKDTKAVVKLVSE